MDTPRPSLLDLHPVEALLALLLISAAALLRLVADPPRPMRRSVPYSSAAIAMRAICGDEPPDDDPPSFAEFVRACLAGATAPGWDHESIRQPQASAAPAHGIAPGVTVAELRGMARQQGLTTAGGRPIHKARKADLLTALDG